MIDKPVPAKIILTPADKSESGEAFVGLSGTLYSQNLIYSEPRELRRKRNKLELTVIFYNTDSFRNWLSNTEIVTYWTNKFDELLTAKPKTIKEKDVLIEVDEIFNCTCNKTDFLILQGRSFQFIGELVCNTCSGHIPYSKIPIDIELEAWQRHYQRVYLNWLDSGIFEKSAYKELTNYKKGKLNHEGERIRKQLSAFFKIPVYINYFIEQPIDNQPCQVCGQEGISSGLKNQTKICKKCNTIVG